MHAVLDTRKQLLPLPGKGRGEGERNSCVLSMPRRFAQSFVPLFSAQILLALSLFLVGCGNKNQQANTPVPPSQSASNSATVSDTAAQSTSQPAVNVSTPVIQPILTVWQEGHAKDAVNLFIQANWNARPIFPSGMVLGMTDAEFKAIPDATRSSKQSELETQLGLIQDLATEVGNEGHDAAAKGDSTRARQCYSALKQFGAALDSPSGQPLVKRTGRVCERMADFGLARLH